MGCDEEILSELDFGGWAEHYATRPYHRHFKGEIYPLFVEALSRLPDGAKVLDVGAGPGHLSVEFYKAHPDSDLSFVLLDSSREMLRIASDRLAGRPITTLVRSFNRDGWEEGIGEVDGIVSNNALCNLRSERLDGFYSTCCSMLRQGAMLLSQDPFGWADGESPYGEAAFPRLAGEFLRELMPWAADESEDDRNRLADEKRAAEAKHKQALARARERGVIIPHDQSGYQFLTVERHVAAMRKAGLAAGCIWRKREFAVLCGIRP